MARAAARMATWIARAHAQPYTCAKISPYSQNPVCNVRSHLPAERVRARLSARILKSCSPPNTHRELAEVLRERSTAAEQVEHVVLDVCRQSEGMVA